MPKSSKSCLHKLCNSPFFWITVVVLLCLMFNNKQSYMLESFTNDDIDYGTGKNLVLFYADWCGHCKNIKPVWDSASKKISNENVKMIKVNCGEDNSKHTQIVEKYNIQGFPTIKLLNNGKVEEDYNGGRGVNDLVNFVNGLS